MGFLELIAVTPNMCEGSELGSFKIKLFNEKNTKYRQIWT